MTTQETPERTSTFAELFDRITSNMSAVIRGKQHVIDLSVLCLVAQGHLLVEDVPGVGKTSLAKALARSLDCSFGRVQFTPDLLPSDVLGVSVYNQRDQSFEFRPGPVFTSILLADEINRASPRTQSALLQAMQEYHVTVAGAAHDLPRPFHVLATQNPLEQEGTYPLPEAQLDRFLMQVDVPYPEMAAERRILLETTGAQESVARPAVTMERLAQIQALIRQMPVPESVVDAILELVRAARPGHGNAKVDETVSWGPGPRAGQAMMLCARARALYDGRLAPSIDDVRALAEPILQHRMALTFSARAEGIGIRDVIAGLVTPKAG